MRRYPRNSPAAAARVVAMTLVADGRLCRDEVAAIERLGVATQLGLSTSQLSGVVHAFCEDLLDIAHLTAADSCRVDPATMASLLAEIDDPALRAQVLALCLELAEADAHVDDGESAVLVALVEQWGLQRAMFEPSAAGAAAA
ncbi:MAG: TerB family tellurite resistance protein [Burkholderiaceae bacterium]|nr:TerB family tellurite resistance protein [Burkholderiaceae bacterium]